MASQGLFPQPLWISRYPPSCQVMILGAAGRPSNGASRERRDALLKLARFSRLGIEGWLKVEAIRALLDRVEKVWNKGPDLQFADDLFVELKGATDCNSVYILEGLKCGTLSPYQRLACLFLGSGQNILDCVDRLKRNSNVVAYEIFSVGTDQWIIGLIVPTPPPEADKPLGTPVLT